MATIFAFLLALSANRFLVALVWLISLTVTSAPKTAVAASKTRLIYLGPALLAAIQFSIALALLYRLVLLDG